MTGSDFKDSFYKFVKFYKSWLMDMELEEEMHPWQQYDQPHPDTVAKQQELLDQETYDELKFVA